MQHQQGPAVVDQRPSVEGDHRLGICYPKGTNRQDRLTFDKSNKNRRHGTAYQTHISNALFQNILFIAYLGFLSKNISVLGT